MGKRFWSVLLVPEGGGAVRSLRIPGRTLYLALGLVVGSLVLGAGLVGFHIWNLRGLRSLSLLRKENASLRSHLTSVNSTLENIEGMVREGEQVERQARLLAGLSPLERGSQKLGVGGPFLPAPQESSVTDPALGVMMQSQSQRLDDLLWRASFQRESVEETMNHLRQLGDRLKSTPSICPLRDQYVISAGFGWRIDPFTGERALHNGLDLRAQEGSPVFATAAGEVDFVGADNEFGLCVRIRHGYGYETSYCHLGSTRMSLGKEVERGDVVGSVGSSGRSTGPHLHYEVQLNGSPWDPSSFILTPRKVVD